MTLCEGLFAQATNVTFNFVPSEAFVRIDGKVIDLLKQSSISLTPGTYEAEFWASRFDVVRRTIVVEAGRPQAVNFGFKKLTSGYNAYKDEKSKYNTLKLKRSIGDGLFIGTILGGTYFVLTGQQKELNQIESDIDREQRIYESDLTDAEAIATGIRYEAAVTSYAEKQKSSNRLRLIGAGVAVGATALGIFYITSGWRLDITRPVYTDKNPFVLTNAKKIDAFITPGTGTSPIGFTLNF